MKTPAFDTVEVISNLGVGEALISTLDKKGVPSMVERTLMAPPRSQFGPIDQAERDKILKRSPFSSTYSAEVDRESAYEMLKKREQGVDKASGGAGETGGRRESTKKRPADAVAAPGGRALARPLPSRWHGAIGSKLGRQIVRGILGSIIGGR